MGEGSEDVPFLVQNRRAYMTQIISFSIVVWILIDRIKPLWENFKFKSILTSAVALACGLLIAFVYHLDLVVALELSETETIVGHIMTGFAIMGGSSCINEILHKLKNPFELPED